MPSVLSRVLKVVGIIALLFFIVVVALVGYVSVGAEERVQVKMAAEAKAKAEFEAKERAYRAKLLKAAPTQEAAKPSPANSPVLTAEEIAVREREARKRFVFKNSSNVDFYIYDYRRKGTTVTATYRIHLPCNCTPDMYSTEVFDCAKGRRKLLSTGTFYDTQVKNTGAQFRTNVDPGWHESLRAFCDYRPT